MTYTVAQSFSNASVSYDGSAGLQEQSAKWLSEVLLPTGRCLDIGCGTGLLGRELRERGSKADLFGLDLAWGMLAEGLPLYGHLACADMECLPFADGSMDAVASNLAMQWAPAPEKVLAEIHRVLKPGGKLCFTVPVPGSLRELEWSWQQLGDDFSHINSFAGAELWQERLQQVFGMSCELEVGQRQIVRWFSTPMEAVRSLKDVGANRVTSGARRGLTGKSAYADMLKHYESLRQEAGIPLTYEILRLKITCQR